MTSLKDQEFDTDEKSRAEICPKMTVHKRGLRAAYVDDLASGKLTIDDMIGIPIEMVKTAVVKLKYG